MSKLSNKKVNVNNAELAPEISDNSDNEITVIKKTKANSNSKKGGSSSAAALISSDSEGEQSPAPVEKKSSDKKKSSEKKTTPPKKELSDSDSDAKPAKKEPAPKKTAPPKKEAAPPKKPVDSDAEKSDSEDEEKKPEPQQNAVVSQIEALSKIVETQLQTFATIKKELKNLATVCKKKLKDRKERVEKDVSISNDLAKLLGIDAEGPYKRSEIVKKINAYVNEKELTEKDDKTKFKPDSKMKKLFSISEDSITKISINKYIGTHIIKKDE